MPIATTRWDTSCPKCQMPAQRVEAEIEERLYGGNRFAGILTARIFTHVHQDGTKTVCRERVPDWLFTLCDMSEIENFRRVVTSFMAKQKGDSWIYQVL